MTAARAARRAAGALAAAAWLAASAAGIAVAQAGGPGEKPPGGDRMDGRAAPSPPDAPSSQPDATPAAGSPYLPLVAGARWVYVEKLGALGARRVELEARGLRPVRGLPEPLFIVHERGDAPILGIDDEGLIGFFVDEGYVVRLSAIGEDGSGGLRLFGEEGVRILPVDPRPGARWQQLSHLFVTPEAASAPRRWDAEVDRVDALQVPAGRFEDVIRVRMQYRDPAVSADQPQISFDDYYARGVGLVKSVTTNHESRAWRRIERALIEYHEPE